MDTETRFKRWTRLIVLIAITVTAVFIVIVGMLGLRINSDLSCGRDRQGTHPQAAIQNHSHELDNSADYVLQEFRINSSDYIRHEFCITAYAVGADGAKLEIIDKNLDVLDVEYITQGQHDECVEITNLTDHNYLGVRCPTCANSTVEVILQEEIAGDTKTHIENDANSISVTDNTAMDWRLESYRSCKMTLKFFFWCYIWTMVGLMFVILILIGFRRFEKFIFEEVDMNKTN